VTHDHLSAREASLRWGWGVKPSKVHCSWIVDDDNVEIRRATSRHMGTLCGGVAPVSLIATRRSWNDFPYVARCRRCSKCLQTPYYRERGFVWTRGHTDEQIIAIECFVFGVAEVFRV